MTKVGGDSIKPGVPASIQQDAREAQPNAQETALPPVRTVKVEITSGASPSAHQLDKMLSGIGVVDAAAVEGAKQSIIEGRFRVNPEVVARKLIATVREQLAVQQKS